MGAARIAEIAALLLRHDKPPLTPAAVIENGTRENERVLIGTLSDIAEVAAAAGLRSPATLVIGEVVRLRSSLVAPAAAAATAERETHGPAAVSR
jgi:siroheme synthase